MQNAWRRAQFGRATQKYERAEAWHYTKTALVERRQDRSLLEESRKLLDDLKPS